MTIAEAQARSGIDTIDGEVLMSALLSQTRAWLFAHSGYPIKPAQGKKWRRMVARRRRGEPVAYITGEKEFFGRPFAVSPAVLIPRPSTEGLVTQVIGLASDKPKPRNGGSNLAGIKYSDNPAGLPVEIIEVDSGISVIAHRLKQPEPDALIVDIGCGSGCIAVTLALELPDREIIGVDISKKALKISAINIKRYHVGSQVKLIASDGAAFIDSLSRPFVAISNPPYIPDSAAVESGVSEFEPHAALFAGLDGLSVIRPLIDSLIRNPLCRGFALECRTDQVAEILALSNCRIAHVNVK